MKPTMKQFAIGCLALFLLEGLFCAGFLLRPSLARRALPWNASGIREHYIDSRFGSDYERCLRASITEAEFLEYARRLGLDRTYVAAEHGDLGLFWPSCEESWWHPPATLDGAFFTQEAEDCFVIAKYSDGCVYFAAVCW